MELTTQLTCVPPNAGPQKVTAFEGRGSEELSENEIFLPAKSDVLIKLSREIVTCTER